MFPRLAEQYKGLVRDLVMSLQALASCLQKRGHVATCYSCGNGDDSQGASFVADLGENHMVRFLVSDFGISWIESRDGHELVKLEGAEAIQEMHRVAQMLQATDTAPQPGVRASLQSSIPQIGSSQEAA